MCVETIHREWLHFAVKGEWSGYKLLPFSWTIVFPCSQIYIGGDVYGEQLLQDDPMAPRDSAWLMYPGGTVETVCDSLVEALYFSGKVQTWFTYLNGNAESWPWGWGEMSEKQICHGELMMKVGQDVWETDCPEVTLCSLGVGVFMLKN